MALLILVVIVLTIVIFLAEAGILVWVEKLFKKVLINGQVLNESYYNGETLPDSSVTLGQDQYFVLGDNRTKSSDSRIWGPITKSSIRGKIFYKVSGLKVPRE